MLQPLLRPCFRIACSPALSRQLKSLTWAFNVNSSSRKTGSDLSHDSTCIEDLGLRCCQSGEQWRLRPVKDLGPAPRIEAHGCSTHAVKSTLHRVEFLILYWNRLDRELVVLRYWKPTGICQLCFLGYAA